jgi:hypothetical protein
MLVIARAATIQHVFSMTKPWFNRVGVTYFYFTTDDRSRSIETITIALLTSLVGKSKIVPKPLLGLFERYGESTTPGFEEIVLVMESYMAYYSSIFVFVDALDESTEEQRKDVLTLMKRLCECGFRVFLTSQEHLKQQVEKVAEKASNLISYEIKARDDDLSRFIRDKLGVVEETFPILLGKTKAQIQDRKDEICEQFIQEADGM